MRIFTTIILSLSFIMTAAVCAGSSESNTFGERIDHFFELQSADKFNPRPIKKDWNDRGDFTRHYGQSVVMFAYKSFYLDQDLEKANNELIKLCEYHIERPQTFYEIHSFHWFSQALMRICNYYGHKGSEAAGRLSDQAYETILRTMWLWLDKKSDLSEAEYKKSKTLTVYNSENHHAQHFSTCWSFANALKDSKKYKDKKLSDGFTAGDHYRQWSEYISEYLLQRGRKGMLVEIASPSYATATLKAIVYVYDFAEEPVLKRRADNYLKLYWAMWAQEQLNGVRGGAKTRCYPKSSFRGTDFARRAAWFYLGIGDEPFIHASMLTFATSKWRIPQLIADLAESPEKRGVYEIRQRRMGLVEPGFNQPPLYKLNGDEGGILRYSWASPHFITGTLMTKPLANEKWAAISSQNRWQGVIFSSHVNARIYPHCRVLGDSSYNQFWSVQSKGTLITRKLESSRNAGEMMVWFSGEGIEEPIYRGGWIFADAGQSWAAVKVLNGKFKWEKVEKPAEGRWLILKEEYSPIIIETAGREKYESFLDFIKAVVSTEVDFDGKKLEYKSIYGDELNFFAVSGKTPEINGESVNYAPKKVYDSPFISSVFDSGVVEVSFDGQTETLDFN